MATSTVACNVCSVSPITTSSAFWCSECDEGFCTDGREYHIHANATREDYIITIDEYQKLPPLSSELSCAVINIAKSTKRIVMTIKSYAAKNA
jgi:hypothetical protein